MTSRVPYHRHPENGAHIADTSAVHAASAISFTPNGSIAATDVQAAIQEVRDEVVASVSDFIPHDPSRIGSGAATVAAASNRGDYPVGALVDAAKRLSAYAGRFRAVPTNISIVAIAQNTGNLAWYCTTDIAAATESYNVHSDSIASDGTPSTTAVTADKITLVDITAAFTDAAAGDFFGLEWIRDGDDATDTVGNEFVLGLLVTY